MPHLVSRICHAGAVANVDFRLCRSMLDGNKLRRKVESSSSEATAKTTETRQGECIFLILLKKVTFYFIVRVYPSLF